MDFNKNNYYIFYDGDCGFCLHWVQWILARDKNDLFVFVSLQSDKGKKFLSERGLDKRHFDTLYLWSPGKYYLQKSDAVLKIVSLLGGWYTMIVRLNFFPRVLSDYIYQQIAKKRGRISVLKDCKILSEKDQKKFI
jgi:predicted DCC family thiol-disulfide oxidoreductase YuxK